MDNVGSLRGRKAFMDFTGGFSGRLGLFIAILFSRGEMWSVLEWLWRWKLVAYMLCLTGSTKKPTNQTNKQKQAYEISYNKNVDLWLLKKKIGTFHVTTLE